jgi:hypothetical protein
MNFAWNAQLPRSIQGSFTCRKSTTWDQQLYFPSEGRRDEDFFARKKSDGFGRVWTRLRGTWVPKASTLPLDHRSRFESMSFTIAVFSSRQVTAYRQLESNAMFLSQDSSHYLFTPWRTVLLGKLNRSQLVKNFPSFCGTRRFNTAFTHAHHLSLSLASSIQSIHPHPTSWRSILILSSHLRLGLPICLFPSGFPTKNLYTLILYPPTRYMHRPSRSSPYNPPNNIGWGLNIIKSK